MRARAERSKELATREVLKYAHQDAAAVLGVDGGVGLEPGVQLRVFGALL
jgi:hypothetical protein